MTLGRVKFPWLKIFGSQLIGIDFGDSRAFSGKVESGGIPKEARIRFKIPTGTRGPVMNGEAILQ